MLLSMLSYMNLYELSQFKFLFNELISICKTLSEGCIAVMFVCFKMLLCLYTTCFLKELLNLLGLFTVALKESNSTFQWLGSLQGLVDFSCGSNLGGSVSSWNKLSCEAWEKQGGKT